MGFRPPHACKMAARKKKKAIRSVGGRPTKLTATLHRRFIKAVKYNYFETASAMCGIDQRNARKWLKRGSDELERIDTGKPPKPTEKIYAAFTVGVRVAEGAGEGEMVKRLVKHGENDPSSVIRFLERKFPKHWGNRLKITQELETEIDAIFAKLNKHLTPEEYDRVIEVLDAPDS